MNPGWLALIAAAAYLPSLAGAFQFDDFNVIVDNPAVHSWPAFVDGMTGVRPLLKASYTWSWTLGLGALGFHLFNIAVHAANTLLAYFVGRELCWRWSVAHHAAALAALLFALHPVQVEAVTYVSGRSASLMAFFYLGAVLAYLRGYALLGPLLFVLAAATKETALTLPAALVLVDLASRERVQWKRHLPYWALFAAAAAYVLLNPRYFALASFGFLQRDAAQNLLTQVGGISWLVARLVGLQGPSLDPALPVAAAWDPVLALQAALLGLLLLAGVLQLGRRPWLGFGVLWFFLQLAPTNSVIPRLDVANDRQLYLAGWGLFLAAAVQLGKVPRLALAGLALACAVGSVTRQLDFRSEVSLWEAEARRAPWNARAYNNLGYAYAQAGRAAEARRAYETALALDPRHVKARMNLLNGDRPHFSH